MKVACKLVLVILLLMPKAAEANHCAGGELIYEWVSDSTYRFFLKFYRDCTGITEQQTVAMCYENNCNSYSNTINLNKISTLPNGLPNGSPIASGCPGYPTTCDNPAGSIPDYREWWYTGTITLPFRCNSWHFKVWISSRNISVNVSQNVLAIETAFDNAYAQGNSSPYFSVKPVPYVCLNQSYTYNNGVIDVDNDSFAYNIMMPQTTGTGSGGQCFPFVPLQFTTATPPYNLTNNPFQTNNSFSLQQITGNLSFTPGLLGPQTITIVVSEYRNHHLIGYVMRDIQVQVLNCTSAIVNLNIPPATLVNAVMVNGVVSACANKPFSFCYDLVAADTTAILVVKDNHSVAIPPASINYSAQATDSIRGCFSWYPTINDTGLKVISVQVKDSTCHPPGVAVTQTFTIPIRVNSLAPPPQVISPVYYCVKDIPGQLPVQGTNLLWYTNPFGGTGSPTPPTINTANTSSTTYYVSQNATGCESIRVPITVIVRPIPIVKIISEDSLCQYNALLISNIDTTQINTSYSWSVDTAKYSGNTNNSVIVASWSTPGTKKIILTASLGSCSVKDSASIYVVSQPIASFEINHDICVTDTTKVDVKQQDQSHYYWKIDNIFLDDTVYKSPLKLFWITPGLKKLHLKVINRYGCFSNYDTTVNVHELPTAKIQVVNNNICTDGTISLRTVNNTYYRYEWTPGVFFKQNYLPDIIASISTNTNIFLKVTNQWSCSAYDSTELSADVCCSILLPDAFTPNGDGLNDKFHVLTMHGQMKLNAFMIADRWGNIVFNTTDINQGWDGTYKNSPQDPGTYFYYIKYVCGGDEGIKKGNFTLLR
jgi:gliding motility-associated-like protein